MSETEAHDDAVGSAGARSHPTQRRHLLDALIVLLAVAVVIAGLVYVTTVSVILPAMARSVAGDQTGDGAGEAAWATDVFWSDVAPGACLDQSFSWESGDADAVFNANSTGFRIVDCGSDHVARVLFTVDKPLSYTWQRFGASDGATRDEVDRWVGGVCAATQELLEFARSDGDDPSTVAVAKSQYGLPILGHCVLVARAGVTDSPGGETLEDLRVAAASLRSFDP